jgi:hypothetical protein
MVEVAELCTSVMKMEAMLCQSIEMLDRICGVPLGSLPTIPPT